MEETKTYIEPYWEVVFIHPIENNNDLYKGKVYKVGPKVSYKIKINSIVYYNINDTIKFKEGRKVYHAIPHYKIIGIEKTMKVWPSLTNKPKSPVDLITDNGK